MTTDETASSTAPATKRPKHRSPSYPGISLEVAVARARQIYERERQHRTPVDAVLSHWGYSSKSSGGLVALAALKKYGLLDDSGSGPDRVAWVTDLAVDAMENPDPDQMTTAIQTAALMPTIHAEMWNRFGATLPSDQNLRWELVRQKDFTESGAAEFISNYKETLEYAGLDMDDTVDGEAADANGNGGGDENDQRDDGTGHKPLRDRAPRPNVTTIPLPLIDGGQASVEFEGPITEAAWAQFLGMLELLKPGVIERQAAADETD